MGPANEALARQLAGVLFFTDALFFLPYAGVALGAGYWGARHARAPLFVLPIWLAASAALVLGVYPLAAAFILWCLFRHYYIDSRWKNPFRGGGAPGFMSHWVSLYLVLFEGARVVDASGGLSASVRFMANVDFGVILLCSGTYKALSGYMQGEGMEYGLANPMWGYWFGWFRRRRPSHVLFRAQDAWASVAQIMTGLCLLVGASDRFLPGARVAGALLCIASFGYLLPTVRLGRLAILMMVAPLWFLPELGLSLPSPLGRTFSSVVLPGIALAVLHGLTIAYVVLLPPLKAMQYLNLFAKVQLPGPLQAGLTWYANKVPIIMWRVFTPDVTNFFVRIHRIERETGERVSLVHEDSTYAYRDLARLRWSLRFLHVTESIALTTVFTTLKYFRSQRELFEKRLRDYVGTLGYEGEILELEYVAILKGKTTFEYEPIARFAVDLRTGEIQETRLVPDFEYDAPAKYSHIKETAGYGTYAPRAVK